jgi:putative Mn2+ efflux pump MntP
MHCINMILIAVGLGADAMSICMGIGIRWNTGRHRFRLAWHMGFFQFIMPIIGWSIGERVAGAVASVAPYVAGSLIIFIGLKMLYEAITSKPGDLAQKEEHAFERAVEKAGARTGKDPTRGWSLVFLSVATSLDALVVGFSLGIKNVNIWGASILIGFTAAAMALAGVIIGKHVGMKLGRFAELAGAFVLIALGISFMFT